MILIKESKWHELPEFIQEQVYRELESEEDLDVGDPVAMEERLRDVIFYLYEYDPTNPEDLSTLSFFLKQKIDSEGKADDEIVDEIGQSGEILDPILIEGDRCCEGRHRLSASLKYNLKIKAFAY